MSKNADIKESIERINVTQMTQEEMTNSFSLNLEESSLNKIYRLLHNAVTVFRRKVKILAAEDGDFEDKEEYFGVFVSKVYKALSKSLIELRDWLEGDELNEEERGFVQEMCIIWEKQDLSAAQPLYHRVGQMIEEKRKELNDTKSETREKVRNAGKGTFKI